MSSILVDEIALIPVPDELIGRSIDTPLGAQSGYSLSLSGWALGREAAAVAVEITCLGRTFGWAPLMIDRPDVAAAHSEVAEARESGFRTLISLLGAPASFELGVYVVLQDGRRVSLGLVRGRRNPLPADFTGGLQPIMLTSIGRTGTHWLACVLSQHPRIGAYRVFELEPRFLNYWTSVLRSLADPMSSLQALTAADMESEHWWLGAGNFDRPSNGTSDGLKQWLARTGLASVLEFWHTDAASDARSWLGARSVEELAAFCQRNIQGFYQATISSGDGELAYFVEKSLPHSINPDIAWELYPSGREIMLVRDFRDVACSMSAFGRLLGYRGPQSERTALEEGQLDGLNRSAVSLARAWRRRRERAHLVRYEDLIREPIETMRRTLDYLDLDDAPDRADSMLEAARETNPNRQNAHRTIQDPMATIGRSRRELDRSTRDALTHRFREVLEEFGYDTSARRRRMLRGGRT